jgi:glyoxylase-like metal-dependent hydrolase (beta-lactamase superfamily II)
MNWTQILPTVFLFRDSCNVYAVAGGEGMIIVDAGTGRWLEHIDELPAEPAALLLTHYFRDHSAGAVLAARAGIPIYVPEYERNIFADPAQHFRERETYVIYDNVWDLFAPIEGVPIAGVLRDYDKVEIAGLHVEIIPLPGATYTQIGIGFQALQIDGPSKNIVCCGETIHSPGKIARVAPLQYNYNDLDGALNVYTSTRWLRERGTDVLLPSMGEPILDGAEGALDQLQQSLKFIGSSYAHLRQSMEQSEEDLLERVTDHVWRRTHDGSLNWFLISESGKVLVIDYGYDSHNTRNTHYSRPANRRAFLHSIKGLEQRFGSTALM